jgi:hypothetical protein
MTELRPGMAEVSSALAKGMRELVRELCGAKQARITGDCMRVGSHGAVAIQIGGPRRGSWFDHEAGVAHMRGLSMRDAWEWAVAWLGLDTGTGAHAAARPAPAPLRAPRTASKTANLAQEMWSEATPAEGTLVEEEYLPSRGLLLPTDSRMIRFHPRAWRSPANGPHGPAMVALMTTPVGNEPCGVHLTYLREDGAGKAGGDGGKIMLGRVGVIRLSSDESVTTGLGICEGIETGLALAQRLGWAPIWVATSAGAIRNFPLLPGLYALTVFADADDPGMDAARACCNRHAEAGREATILSPPRGDWDDALPRRSAA